jgi:hypothetical protein
LFYQAFATSKQLPGAQKYCTPGSCSNLFLARIS